MTVPLNKPYISFIGHEQRASETVISWHNKASDKDSNGIELGTYKSASVSVFADFFCATGITFAVVSSKCLYQLYNSKRIFCQCIIDT